MEPRHWQTTTQLIKFEPMPIYLEISFILFAKFLLFLMLILKAKKKKIKTFPCLLKKCEQQTQTHLL